MVVMMRLCGSQ